MAEDTKENTTPETKTFTQEEVERMIKGRGKKMEEQIAELQSQKEALNSQMANLQSMQQQPSVPQVPEQAPTQGMEQPEGMQAQQPLTADAMQQMLAEHAAKQQNEMQAMQAHQYAHQNLQGLLDEDKDFRELANKPTDNVIPQPAIVSIMNRFNPKVAKGVLKNLMTNPYAFAVMKNHYLEGKFEHWLGQAMNSNSQDQNQGMPSPPDLSGDSIKGDNAPQFENAIDSYMKNVK